METVACSQTKRKRRRRGGGGKEASFPNIPEEIILQILQRLPLDSLSRFNCVSKTWCSLISDFAAEKRGREMVLVVSHDLLHSIDLENYHGERLYEEKSKFRAIYGSCNGLVLMGIDQDLFLWNPLTSYFNKVLHYDRLSSDYCTVSGLCYDSSTDDYMVVMVLLQGDSYSPEFGSDRTVVVGSFKGKSWTEVDCSSYIISSFNSGPTVNEHLHWYVSRKETFKYSQIVYFDTQMGTFKKVPMPWPKQSDGDVVYDLGVLDGCLCMSRKGNRLYVECNYIEVLVMKEYGVANSWTLMFTVSDLRPFGYTRKGEALALKVPPLDKRMDIWHVSAYNPIDNSTWYFPIPTPMPTFTYHGVYAIMYEESLVKPTDYNWEDEELREEATYVEYYLNGSHAKMKMERCTYWRRQVERREQPVSQDGWSEEEE